MNVAKGYRIAPAQNFVWVFVRHRARNFQRSVTVKTNKLNREICNTIHPVSYNRTSPKVGHG